MKCFFTIYHLGNTVLITLNLSKETIDYSFTFHIGWGLHLETPLRFWRINYAITHHLIKIQQLVLDKLMQLSIIHVRVVSVLNLVLQFSFESSVLGGGACRSWGHRSFSCPSPIVMPSASPVTPMPTTNVPSAWHHVHGSKVAWRFKRSTILSAQARHPASPRGYIVLK